MFSDMSANEGGQPTTDKVPYSIQELQKRYTERHKRRQEEKTLLKLIGDVKAQITQVKTIENILFRKGEASSLFQIETFFLWRYILINSQHYANKNLQSRLEI